MRGTLAYTEMVIQTVQPAINNVMRQYVERGIISELLVSDVLYSSRIGLRYLNDILRGFYGPSTPDSGVKLVTP